MTASKSIDSCKRCVDAGITKAWLQPKKMAEIARDAILYGGKDLAKRKSRRDLLQKLVANGCDEAEQPAVAQGGASLNEARSVIVVLWRGRRRAGAELRSILALPERATRRQLTPVLDIGDGVWVRSYPSASKSSGRRPLLT